MANPYEAVLDGRQRIHHFVPEGFPGIAIEPERMNEYINGGEQVTYHGIECGVRGNGSLVPLNEELPDWVELGSGAVVLGAEYVARSGEDEYQEDERLISIGARAVVWGTEIHDQVQIGSYSVIRAQKIGPHALVGSYVRIFDNSVVHSRAVVDDAVKIHERSVIGAGAWIQFAARLRYNTRVGAGAVVGPNRMVGDSQSGDTTQSGPVISAGAVLLGRGE